MPDETPVQTSPTHPDPAAKAASTNTNTPNPNIPLIFTIK
jgi:hypothetical protein